MQEKDATKSIGKRLRLAIEVRNMSIREFTTACGIEYRTFQDYLADKRKPGADQLVKLSATGIDLDWLLTGETNNGVYFHMPETGGLNGMLGASGELTSFALRRCVALIDAVHEKMIAEGEKPVGTEILVYSAWRLLLFFVKIIERDEAKVLDLIHKGFSFEDVLNGLIGSVGDKLIENAKLVTPETSQPPIL